MTEQTAAEHDRPGDDLPGSDGEHVVQADLDTVERARRFYESAMKDHLTDRMRRFVADRRFAVVGSTDGRGRPRVAYRSGDPGFVRVLDEERVAWRESRAAVDSVLDHLVDGEHATLTLVDWWDSTVGLHLNGRARRERDLPGEPDCDEGERWIVVTLEEAYIHCAKHIPRLEAVDDPGWGSPLDVDGDEVAELTPMMCDFVENQRLAFLVTADRNGETDVSPRLGPHGFVQVLDPSRLAWPEFRGNGVHASLGNIHETGRACLSFLDWEVTGVDLQVHGSAEIRDDVPGAEDVIDIDKTKTWVDLSIDRVSVAAPDVPYVDVVEFDPPWGTDDEEAKKTGYFTE